MLSERLVPTALSSKGLTVLSFLVLAACSSSPTDSMPQGVGEAGSGGGLLAPKGGQAIAGSSSASRAGSSGRSAAGAGGSARADAGTSGRDSSGAAGRMGAAGATGLAGDGAAEGGMGGSATGESGAGGAGRGAGSAGNGGAGAVAGAGAGGRGGSGGMAGGKAGAGGAGGAGRGSAGSGGAGAGASGSGAGDDCSACELGSSDNACRTAVSACDQLQGVTGPDSPTPNVSKADLCRQLLDCEHTTRCAANQITDCLCGAGVDPVVCYPTQTLDQADGACKTLIAAAAETEKFTEIATRISDVNYAVGAAHAVIESCDYQGCFNRCLQ